ncbi:MAG TPA: TfoX/Sxy family protein [Methylococcaceae bacterium]|nr:TfoX/Sxy family protein [Methylococcaceae bacterium]
MSTRDDIQRLAERVRAALAGMAVTEKRMFGGITFMLDGNMLCCASKQGLMVRVGKDAEPEALRLPHAQPCDGARHKMPGFVVIAAEGLSGNGDFSAGLGLALRYVSALPPKETSPK